VAQAHELDNLDVVAWHARSDRWDWIYL